MPVLVMKILTLARNDRFIEEYIEQSYENVIPVKLTENEIHTPNYKTRTGIPMK